MADSQFCSWCLERRNRASVGNFYCVDCTKYLCAGCAEPHLQRARHRIPPASNLKFCDMCSHTHACAFCWDCKRYMCDICSAKHNSTGSTKDHAIEHHQWDSGVTEAAGDIGTGTSRTRTAVFGIPGNKTRPSEDRRGLNDSKTDQRSMSGSESNISSLIYSDVNVPVQSSLDQQSNEHSDESICNTSVVTVRRSPAGKYRGVPNEVEQINQQPDPPPRQPHAEKCQDVTNTVDQIHPPPAPPPRRPPKPVTTSVKIRKEMYSTSEEYGAKAKAEIDYHAYDYIISPDADSYGEDTASITLETTADNAPLLPPHQEAKSSTNRYLPAPPVVHDSDAGAAFDNGTYEYISYTQPDIPLANANSKQRITQMHVHPDGNFVLYDEYNKQLMLYDAKLTKCLSSHQMQSTVLYMCTVRLGREDRIYVVPHGTCSKSSEIIHFVIDNASNHFQTKGSMTIGHECSGLTGYYLGIAVIQNMKKGKILLHLYNKDYSKDKVLPFDFRLSLANKFGNRQEPELRYSLSTAGRGKLVVIADCKYNFVSIVEVEKGQQVLKYDHASLACPSQVSTYKDDIVLVLCKASGNVHVLAITVSADQRLELTDRDTINLKEWSPGAMCCCPSEGALYVSNAQVGIVRLYKLFEAI